MPDGDLSAFRDRVAELEDAHRRRFSLGRALADGVQSWLWRWARGLVTESRPALVGPPPTIPMPAATECALTFIGHATALVRYANARFITDPCFARSLYTLRRVREAVLPTGALEGIDVALISHAHADHLHAQSIERLPRSTTIVLPRGARAPDGWRAIATAPGETIAIGALEVTCVPAQHRVGFGGRAVGYVVRGDGPTVYFAGDTGYFSGFLDVGARFRPDVALLPISGYRPRSLRRDHLSPLDALYAFEDLRAQLLVPIHHSAFPLGYEPVGEPMQWLRSLASARAMIDRVAWLDPGQSCVARLAFGGTAR